MALDTTDQTPLVPATFDNDVYTFALQAFLAQGRANVLSAQPSLLALSDPTGILDKASSVQVHLRKMANFYLQSTTSNLVKLFPVMDNARNLAVALNDTVGTAKGAAATTRAVADAFTRTASDIGKIVSRTGDAVNMTKDAVSEFDEEIDKVMQKLDGDNGQIAAVSAAIDKVQTNINTDLENIVKSSNEIGNGVKQLITYVLTVVTTGAGSSEEKKNPEGGKSGDTTATKGKTDGDKSDTGKDDGGDTPKEDPFGSLDPFPVESIGSIEEGVGQSVAVMQALRNDNKRMVQLMQAKAELSAALTVCQSIRIQGDNFATSLDNVSKTLATVQKAFADTASNYTKLSNAFTGVADDTPEYFTLVRQIKDANSDWDSISRDLKDIERGFAGIGSLFPPAG